MLCNKLLYLLLDIPVRIYGQFIVSRLWYFGKESFYRKGVITSLNRLRSLAITFGAKNAHQVLHVLFARDKILSF